MLCKHIQNDKLTGTIPLKPLVSAPLRTESDISVTAAKITLDPAVLSCRVGIEIAYGKCRKKQKNCIPN